MKQLEIEELKEKISAKKEEYKQVEEDINEWEIDPDDYEEEHDEMLDECYPEVKIGCCTFSPSRILKELDPIAYRQSLLDYVDTLDVSEDKRRQELVEKLDSLQEEIEDLKSELEDLEAEENEEDENA